NVLVNPQPKMNEAFVAAGDAALFTETIGDPEAPAVLLVMGGMASAGWWARPFCGQLAAPGLFVIRYDDRDTGRSTSYGPGASTYSTETLADDALAVLDAHNLDSADFVGMSLGGYLSQLVALKRPHRVRTLTLIASERLALADPAMPQMD